MHKVGGYPAYIQPGNWDKRYEFIFQISSDEKARFNIVDSEAFISSTVRNWIIGKCSVTSSNLLFDVKESESVIWNIPVMNVMQ